MAADINHANFPVGPVGVPTEFAPVLQPDDLQVHQVPEGGEGVPALHDGGGAVRRRGCTAPAATSRTPLAAYEKNPIWTVGSEAHAVSRRGQEPAPGGLRRQARLRVGRRARRLHRRQHGGRGGSAARRRRRKRRSARRSAPSATTRSDARPSTVRRGRSAPADTVALGRRSTRRRCSRRACSSGFRTTATRSGCCSCCRRRLLLLLFLTYPLGPRHLARLHRRQDRPRRRVDRPRELRVPVGRQRSRGWRSSTRSSTRVVASVFKFVLGLWLALLLNQQHAASRPSSAPSSCCRSSCRRRCRRSRSGGSTTRSSRSSAGCWSRWA